MIMAAAGTCSLWLTVTQSLLGGLLGSLGFFVNMFIISGAVYLWKKHKVTATAKAAQQAAADLLLK